MSETKKQPDLETSKAVFDLCKKEYDYETDRQKALDSRASAFLSVNAAIFALFARTVKIPPEYPLCWKSILVIFYLATLFLLGLGIYSFLKTLDTKNYSRYDLTEVVRYSFLSNVAIESIPTMCSSIRDIIARNSDATNQKFITYKRGINLLTVSIVLIGLIMAFLTIVTVN